jgi:hypothetical protein
MGGWTFWPLRSWPCRPLEYAGSCQTRRAMMAAQTRFDRRVDPARARSETQIKIMLGSNGDRTVWPSTVITHTDAHHTRTRQPLWTSQTDIGRVHVTGTQTPLQHAIASLV